MGEAAHGLGQGAEPRPVLVGAGLAEAADPYHYQAWIDRLQLLIPKPPTLHRAGAKALDQDIRVLDQPFQDLGALGLAQVQRDALLVTGVEFPGERYPIFERAHGAEPVAILGMLDFDHLGAKVPHECCRHGPGEELARVQNLQSFKRHTVAVSRIRPLSHTVPPIPMDHVLGNHGTTKPGDGEAVGTGPRALFTGQYGSQQRHPTG